MAESALIPNRVFLTGCTGEIGSRVAILLLKAGYEVHGVRRSKSCAINHQNHSCKNLDLLDRAVDSGLKEIQPQILVHTAWFTKPNEFWQSNQNDNWLTASKRLISEFVEIGGEYLVVTGSCAEYSWTLSEALSENSLEKPSSKYGQAKLALLNWLRLQELPFLWTRTFFQFGMNEPAGRLIPSLIDSFSTEREFVIRSGNDVRDFVFVEDVARVLALLISQREKGLINIGTGVSTEVAKLSKLTAELFGRSDLLRFELNQGTRTSVVSNPKKLNSMIGDFRWSPIETALIASIEARKR